MAKKKKTHKRPQRKIPLLTVLGFVPGATALVRTYKERTYGQSSAMGDVGVEASRIFIGIDPRVGLAEEWHMGYMWYGTFPIVIGALASKIAGKMGINRMFKGLPIKL